MIRKYLYLTLFILMIALINSCGNNEQSSVTTNERVISVKATVIAPRDIQITRSYTGSVEGEQQAVLYAKIAEAVEKVNASEGDQVNTGTVLINLDKSGPSLNYYQAKSVFQNAEKNYNKMEYLYGEGAISESDYDAAKTNYEVSKAGFDAASKLVNIESPITGILTSLDVAAGDFVQVGQKLATVATTSNLRVKFSVNAAEVRNFTTGMKVRVVSDQNQAETEGKVISVASSADPVTRSFEIEVLVNNSDNLYKPGMFVRILHIQESLENVIVIPRKSILTLNNKETVFVINNGVAEKKEVVLGSETNGFVVISSGLIVGDTLVTLGHEYLGDDTKIRITELSEGVK